MDDWFSLLLIFIFFVLPLLEQIRGKKGAPPPPPPVEESAEGRIAIEEPPAGSDPAGTPDTGWSGDWGSWPSPQAETPASNRPIPSGEATTSPKEPTPRWQEPAPRWKEPAPRWEEPSPHREESAPRSEEPEPVEVSEREAARLNELLNRQPVAEEAPRRRSVPPVPRRPPADVPPQSRPLATARSSLRSREEIRRAIVLNEVLSPPLATRDWE